MSPPAGPVTVTRAGPAQFETVAGLVGRLLLELDDGQGEFAGLDAGRLGETAAGDGARFAAFLATDPAGRALGVVTLTEAFALYAGGRYGIISELYVVPEARSAGIGAALLAAVRRHGQAAGWRRVDVTAPPGARWAPTVRFYERHGFVFTGPKLRCTLVPQRG